MATKGPISSLVIQALQELGKAKVVNEIRARILQILQNETEKNLEHDAKLASAWIAAILKQAKENIS